MRLVKQSIEQIEPCIKDILSINVDTEFNIIYLLFLTKCFIC